ncbi:Guanylate kinase-associated protein mars [Eumeta japonica]|uniref:Guanylate kinase-associated protein mars n=1 Tax=Eumeta variegata TaxID=151549 RepID=A0A4C1XJT3_EUMVA|nr:Guanylate kinase-associated protein mars [Eumeta japonica]
MTNVAAGTLKRLKESLRDKKRSRCTGFDSVRNLSKSDSPIQLTEAERKLQKRKEQLIKWRQERQQKKQIAAQQKKKPFVVGIVHQPLTFAPPPPVLRYAPSTSGRVTRSQTARMETIKQKEPKQSSFKSFAHKNTVFQPPKLNITTYPILQLDTKIDKNTQKTNIQKAVENFAKNSINLKPLPTRSQTTKPIPNAKILKPVVMLQNINFNQKETTSNKGDISKTNVKDKINFNLRNKMNIVSKNNKLTKTNVKKTANKLNSVPKVEENNMKTKTIEFIIEENSEVNLKKVGKNPKRVQTPRRPITKHKSDLDKKSDILFSLQENTVFGTSEQEAKSQDQDDTINITPKNIIPKSESSSEEKLKKQCLNDSVMTPEQIRKEAERISPCVILSRGKDNARRELKQKLQEGLIDEMGSIESVHHFRQQLNSEIVRMTKMCETWDQIFANEDLPEPVQEQILSATGQARLLMSQKFQQFSGLVDRCAAGEECVGGGLVTPTDLQGFWDMIFIQVENIDLRFIELEKLKRRGWTEDEKVKQLAKKSTINNNVKKKSKPAATSRLREMITAARKALKEQSNSPTSSSEDQQAYCVRLPFSESPVARCSDSILVNRGSPCTPSNVGRVSFSAQAQKSTTRRGRVEHYLNAPLMRRAICNGDLCYRRVSPHFGLLSFTSIRFG